MSALVVLTNVPDRAVAERLARDLVARRLAACVNLLAPCRSSYRWEGAIQHDEEHPLLIKTTAARYAALEAAIRAAHPYELPEIVAVPVERGLADVVYGSRFIGRGAHRVLFFWHSVGNQVLTQISNMFSNLNLTEIGRAHV